MLDLIMLAMLIGIIVVLAANAVAKDAGCALLFAYGAALAALVALGAGVLSFGWWLLPW